MALPFDDDSGEGFWGGNQLCGVSYALAVAATSIILSFPQQGLASQLVTDRRFLAAVPASASGPSNALPKTTSW